VLKKKIDGAPRIMFNGIFTCWDTIHECDGRTDRHRPTASTALTQRLNINDDGTKVVSQKYSEKVFSKYYFILYFQSTF